MKIFVIIGSQRLHGKSDEIIKFLDNQGDKHEIKYIHLGEKTYNPCIQCFKCSKDARCHNNEDRFNEEVLEEIIKADVLIITSPLFAYVPSKLGAILERLTSISFFFEDATGRKRPLKGKKCAVVCYNSQKVHYKLENEIKMIMKQIVATNRSPYKFLNDRKVLGEYIDVIDYLKAIFDGPISYIERDN